MGVASRDVIAKKGQGLALTALKALSGNIKRRLDWQHCARGPQQEPSFTLTVLQCHSSKAKLPSHLKVITIAESYPTVADQFRMVDAAITAGVRRYVPLEYGLYSLRPDPQALNSAFHDKGKVQEYLRTKAEEGAMEWMSISCVSALKKPEETKNTTIYLCHFAITQKQLLEAIEKTQGEKYRMESVDSQVLIEEKQEAVRKGG
ncbi:hypothetical protein DL767_001568 [Monosporascus sp. MG133]|nr:hypothetical protein DL767_001568 [Monosporascus sp. MG133]